MRFFSSSLARFVYRRTEQRVLGWRFFVIVYHVILTHGGDFLASDFLVNYDSGVGKNLRVFNFHHETQLRTTPSLR